VALPDVSSLPDGFRVDWDKHKNRALVKPMKPLLQTRFGDAAWDAVIHQHSQKGLDAFSAD
jgi:hypothetical protein